MALVVGGLRWVNCFMFVQTDLALTLSFDDAAKAFDRALADGGLVPQSRRAMAEGLAFVMPVGPRGGHCPARQVVVRMRPLRGGHQRLGWALRWETEGATGGLFPSLDANLELAAGDQPDMSQLSIIGCYQPPLASLGQTLDQAVMSKVASSTMSAMLREIAAQLQNMTP